MKSKDIMMESIADLMWKVEDEVTPNQAVPHIEVDCTGGNTGDNGRPGWGGTFFPPAPMGRRCP